MASETTEDVTTTPLLSADDVAAQLGKSPYWVKKMCREGKIAHRRVGSGYRFTQADITDYLEAARRARHEQTLRERAQHIEDITGVVQTRRRKRQVIA